MAIQPLGAEHHGPRAYKVLDAVDTATGAYLREACDVALELAPHLAEVGVLLNNVSGPAFIRDRRGLGSSLVSLSGNTGYFEHAIDIGYVERKMGRFRDFYAQLGLPLDMGRLVTAASLHEFGHGDDYYRYIVQAGGDPGEAFMAVNRVRYEQIASLPLGMMSTVADAAWANNTHDYRDRMMANGVTEAEWPGLVAENRAAYANTGLEVTADDFALCVLARLHGVETPAGVASRG